jgi:hypothetical protein
MVSSMDGRGVVSEYFLELRARVLDLAAGFDRIERAPGGSALLREDPGLQQLRAALGILAETGCTDRTERILRSFSLEG